MRDEAVKLYLAGMSFRKVAKHVGVHHQSIRNWVAAAAQALPAHVSETAPTETVEIDELFTFVGSKKGRFTLLPRSPERRD